MADVHGSWGPGTRATTSGGGPATKTKARTEKGAGVGVGPVTRNAGQGVGTGGARAVAGNDRWAGTRGNRVTNVAGLNRWGKLY